MAIKTTQLNKEPKIPEGVKASHRERALDGALSYFINSNLNNNKSPLDSKEVLALAAKWADFIIYGKVD